MRILIAEPSRIGRNILQRMLEEGGHQVESAETAQEALARVEMDHDIDVLVTAIEFEGMSGLELCWSARLHAGPNRPLFIMVISSSTDEEKLAEALDVGADDFIAKPPRKVELLARLRSAARILEFQRELVKLASYDALTDLRNRRAFFQMLEEAEASPEPRTIILLDIDFFKRVNDQHGHDAGDCVLKEVANRLRSIDSAFARVGGEEFALLFKGGLDKAGIMAEAARRAIAASPMLTPAGELAVTISLGVAQRGGNTPFEQVMKAADVALYASKSGGRNRVTLARTADNGDSSGMSAIITEAQRVA